MNIRINAELMASPCPQCGANLFKTRQSSTGIPLCDCNSRYEESLPPFLVYYADFRNFATSYGKNIHYLFASTGYATLS